MIDKEMMNIHVGHQNILGLNLLSETFEYRCVAPCFLFCGSYVFVQQEFGVEKER